MQHDYASGDVKAFSSLGHFGGTSGEAGAAVLIRPFYLLQKRLHRGRLSLHGDYPGPRLCSTRVGGGLSA